MKKIAKIIAGIILYSVSAFAQLTDGSTAQNFTMTDLNGTSWDLYTVLGQGKAVVIDVSATWCGPCWNYHNSHALENFYAHYGPTGTVEANRATVFFVEGDAATTAAQLNGQGTTQGNWVSGTPYPIFNPVNPACSTFNTNYNIAFFPTVYLICSDKKVYVLTQPSEAQIVAKMNASCASAFNLDVTSATCQTNMTCTNTISPVVTIKNNGQTTLTSCVVTYKVDNGSAQTFNWSGSLATSATTNATLPSIAVATPGSHTLTVTTSNPNGSADQNTGNDTKIYNFVAHSGAAAVTPVTEGFTTTTFPTAGWLLNNPDGDITWARSTAAGGFATSTNSMFYDAFNYGTVGATDEMTMAPVDLTGTTPSLEFDVAYAPYSATDFEKLEVFVSTDCGLNWISVYNKQSTTLGTTGGVLTTAFVPTAAQWRKETISLASYNTQNKVFVKFTVTNGYGNELYIDNINIKSSGSTGIENTIVANTFNVYPNPAKDFVMVSFSIDQVVPTTVNMYNALGEIVSATALTNISTGTQQLKFETAHLPAGIYVIEVKSGNSSTSRKISVN